MNEKIHGRILISGLLAQRNGNDSSSNYAPQQPSKPSPEYQISGLLAQRKGNDSSANYAPQQPSKPSPEYLMIQGEVVPLTSIIS
jgi:hypothetical protein